MYVIGVLINVNCTILEDSIVGCYLCVMFQIVELSRTLYTYHVLSMCLFLINTSACTLA